MNQISAVAKYTGKVAAELTPSLYYLIEIHCSDNASEIKVTVGGDFTMIYKNMLYLLQEWGINQSSIKLLS